MTDLVPIAPGLWTDGAQPRLIGGRRADGGIVFPANGHDPVPLSPRGKLWSWTRQDFEPKPPYAGPPPFAPYLIGYVALPEVIVETRIVDATLDDLALDLPMELTIVPFDAERSTYAFRPERAG